jgi:hypothetical protein
MSGEGWTTRLISFTDAQCAPLGQRQVQEGAIVGLVGRVSRADSGLLATKERNNNVRPSINLSEKVRTPYYP